MFAELICMPLFNLVVLGVLIKKSGRTSVRMIWIPRIQIIQASPDESVYINEVL